MKNSILPISVLALLLFACGGEEEAQITYVEDITKASLDGVSVLLDNDHLTVIKFTIPPQVELPMHPRLPGVVYSLSDFRAQYKIPDYPPELKTVRKGETSWQGGGVHGVKNVGAITAEFLVVNSKKDNPTPGVISNVAEVSPEKAKVVFAHADAQVIEVSLEPGDKLPAHTAASRAIVALTDANLGYAGGEEKGECIMKAGEVHYHAGGEHTVENLSDQPVKYLVVEMM